MINALRGEALWRFGGRDYRLCLTLGALAELEHHFGAEGLEALSQRLAKGALSARDVVALLAAGLRGAGETTKPDFIESLPVSAVFPDAFEAIAAMLQAAFGRQEEEAQGERGPFPGGR